MEVMTSKGKVKLPAYMPVTTFGDRYPLDRLIQPFLPRVANMAMVSYHYAKKMADFEMPVFIDSGGFAILLPGSKLVERADGLGSIETSTGQADAQTKEVISPEEVLALQERHAQWGATLDFPIPPSETDNVERAKRMQATLSNARWALEAKANPNLRLFGSVQGWDEKSYVECAKSMLEMGFKDVALGGFVPRRHDTQLLYRIASRIRSMLPDDGLLHAFGMGDPEVVRGLFARGVNSVDSSSYVKNAANGKSSDDEWMVSNPSGIERAHAAIANLKSAIETTGAGQ